MIQWLRLQVFTAEGRRSIPSQGTKIPQAVPVVRKKKKKMHEFKLEDTGLFPPTRWVLLGFAGGQCFRTVVLEKTLESPLDCKEIQPVHPKGNWSLIFTGKTDAEAEAPILWPPDTKS